MIAFITLSPTAKERKSCSFCVGRRLQSMALLLFRVLPMRGSQPVSQIKRTPECLNTAAAISAQKENRKKKKNLVVEPMPFTLHCFPCQYKKKKHTMTTCSWASVSQDGKSFNFSGLLLHRLEGFQTRSSFQYKSMLSEHLQGTYLFTLPSLFPHWELCVAFRHGSVLTTL